MWTLLASALVKKPIGLTPFAGLRSQVDLNDRWTLSGAVDKGGFDTSSKKTYNGQAYLGYRLYLLEYPTLIRLGYRVLAQDYRTKDFTGKTFKYDVTQRGPVLGVSMRF